MIKLYLGLDNQDVKCYKVRTIHKAIDKLRLVKTFIEGKIWLFADDGENGDGEILITEYFEKALLALEYGMFHGTIEIHVHHYESYEDAYAVALDMREGNEMCYPPTPSLN